MSEKYQIIRAKRKSIGIRITSEGHIVVRAPYGVPSSEIESVLEKHHAWIERTKSIASDKTNIIGSLSPEQTAALGRCAEKTIALKLQKYTEIMKVSPLKVNITGAQHRFGSCSSKKSVSFSRYLMLYPDEAIDYVVVHELAHLSEMNHSKRFYAIVEKYLPDWKKRKMLLCGENMSLPDLSEFS